LLAKIHFLEQIGNWWFEPIFCASVYLRDIEKNNRCRYRIGNKICIFAYVMRIIAVQTLKRYGETYSGVEQPLLAWYEEVDAAQWNHPNELKMQYRNASVLSNKRVVFNIHGNSYRLIVDIEYRLKIAFVVWFGTHNEYDKIDAKTVSYVKTNKK